MIVVPAIDSDVTASEVLLQCVQNLHAPRSLRHGELGLNLPAEPRRRVTEDRNTEAAFAVDEPDDPLLESCPFLLIVRTDRIVTRHVYHVNRGVRHDR